MKLKKPLISVLMTVYNGEKYIEEAIRSFITQTFQNAELVIVDDGSTDKSKEIIQYWAKRNPSVKYFYYGKNKGFENWHNVLNFGMEKCQGKYIARLDADDIMYPRRLMTQFNYLEKHPEIYMIGSSAEIIDKNGDNIEFLIKKSYPAWMYKYRILSSNPFIHSSLMFRNEGIKYPHRTERFFYFNITAIHKKKIKNIPDVLVKYRINPNGLIATQTNVKGNRYEWYYRWK